MRLYNKVYNILDNKLIPNNCGDKLENINIKINNVRQKMTRLTSSYYRDRLKELLEDRKNIIDDISCYKFYRINKNKDIYDLHGIYGNQIESFLDAIFDYNYEDKNKKFMIITGMGNVLVPKVKKYLDYFDIEYIKKDGYFNILNF